MNNIELNAILYYADFLSLKDISQPVTDNCKYFFIHGAPINSLFIIDLQPVYDEENKYIQQAMQEYQLIRNKFGEEGVESFIDDVCCIKACGMVDAERMLRCIHQYSTKKQRKEAFGVYYKWKEDQLYTHKTINEKGEDEQTECTKYVYHHERGIERSKIYTSNRVNGQTRTRMGNQVSKLSTKQ